MEFACLIVNFLARFMDGDLLTMEEQAKMAQSTSTSAIKSLSAEFAEECIFSANL
jgi:hypothetical protein